MVNRNTLEDWLLEFEIPNSFGSPDPNSQAQTQMNDPNMGLSDPMSGAPSSDPSIGNQNQAEQPAQMPDITQDPQTPDMPEEKPLHDFEVWKNKFFKESIKGNVSELMHFMSEMMHNDHLQSYQKKFVKDNWNILLLRQDSNIDAASKEIRKNIKSQLDRNNPATSVVNHLVAGLEPNPMLYNIFVKLTGYGAMKGDLHRKFIAALIGATQVGTGGDSEDITFWERDYSIMISTRFNARWGDVLIGNWCLREDDADRYLSDPERKRLDSGSPEERDVLRRRVVVESIAKQFETRAFVINVVQEDGSVHTLGWDISNALKAAYSEGKIRVKTKKSDSSEAMIDDNGQIIPLTDMTIYFVRETGQQNDEGEPEKEEVEFLERRGSQLFLTATVQTIRDAAAAFQGTVFKETPWPGNPSDLSVLSNCVYSAYDLLMKQC